MQHKSELVEPYITEIWVLLYIFSCFLAIFSVLSPLPLYIFVACVSDEINEEREKTQFNYEKDEAFDPTFFYF